MDQQIIEKELHKLIDEIRFEKNETRTQRLLGAKKALEWVLDPQRHFNPHNCL